MKLKESLTYKVFVVVTDIFALAGSVFLLGWAIYGMFHGISALDFWIRMGASGGMLANQRKIR